MEKNSSPKSKNEGCNVSLPNKAASIFYKTSSRWARRGKINKKISTVERKKAKPVEGLSNSHALSRREVPCKKEGILYKTKSTKKHARLNKIDESSGVKNMTSYKKPEVDLSSSDVTKHTKMNNTIKKGEDPKTDFEIEALVKNFNKPKTTQKTRSQLSKKEEKTPEENLVLGDAFEAVSPRECLICGSHNWICQVDTYDIVAEIDNLERIIVAFECHELVLRYLEEIFMLLLSLPKRRSARG